MDFGTKEQNGTEQNEDLRGGLDLNEFFSFDKDQMADKDAEYEAEDMKDYDGLNYNPDTDDEQEQDEDLDLGEQDQEDDSLFGNDAQGGQEETDEEFTDADLALFNKKLNKDFADVEELKKFLNEGDKKDAAKANVSDLETAQNVIDYLTPLLDPRRTSDEDLLRREYETIATNNGQDITDEDVQYEIDEKMEKLRDTHQIDLRAKELRRDLQAVYNEHKGKKEKIEAEKAVQAAAQTRAETEAVQNAFAEIFRRQDFFGIKPEKKVIQEAYKKVNSGEFIKKLQSDKNALAKLAVIEAYENEIHKKASSGLTYSDGIRAVRDEFKGVKEQNSGTVITNAQKRGTAGSDSGRGLIQSLVR